MTRTITAVHNFSDEMYDSGPLPFSAEEYSQLKYGDDTIAKKFGYDLADEFHKQHHAELLTNQAIVIPSPYNYVENAATIMTKHFVHRINHLLVANSGVHIDYATIQRKVSYTGDYGLLDSDTRRQLIGNDVFYVNEQFFKNKTLIFVDDVRITGAHENKIVELISESKKLKKSNMHFAYYGRLFGDETRNDIEAYLNNAKMDLDKYIKIIISPNNNFIVRPIKWLLRMDTNDFQYFIDNVTVDILIELWYKILGEGYYSVPDYQENFTVLKHTLQRYSF